jgi:hypothetical protein
MSTPKAAPTFDPAVPMTAKFRSDIAWRLAQGWTWKELAETLSCDADDLRFATETDPEFAEAQERAWTRVIFDGEADAMLRLRKLADSGDSERALHASEVLVKYAAERRDNDTRLAAEKMRSQTRITVEKLKNERAALKEATKDAARKAQEEANYFPPVIRPAPETDEERAKRFERENAECAAKSEAKVYLWGGKHALGRSIPPDESDIRVRVEDDWSVPSYSPEWNLIYWIVPYTATNTRTPDPRDAQAAAAIKDTFDATQPPTEISA